MVRGITGSELKIRGLRCLRFQLGTETYEHTFLVARIASSYHGIMGLDSLRILKALIDVDQGRLWVGRKHYPLTGNECYREEDDFLGKIEQGNKTAKTVEHEALSGKEKKGEPRVSEPRIEQGGKPWEEVYGVITSNITIPPRTTVIAKVNLETRDRVKVATRDLPPTVLLESAGMLIPGIYTGRALSRVYDSKEFHGQGRPKLEQGIDELSKQKGGTHTCHENCLLYSKVAQLEKPGRQETLRQVRGGTSDLERSYASAIILKINTSRDACFDC